MDSPVFHKSMCVEFVLRLRTLILVELNPVENHRLLPLYILVVLCFSHYPMFERIYVRDDNNTEYMCTLYASALKQGYVCSWLVWADLPSRHSVRAVWAAYVRAEFQ